MMTTPHQTVLRDATLFLLPLLVVGGWLGGAATAAGVAVTGLVSLLNLRVLAWVVARLAAAASSDAGEGAATAALVLVAKSLAAQLVYGLLMWVFDPVAVSLGLGCVVLGATSAGLRAAAPARES